MKSLKIELGDYIFNEDLDGFNWVVASKYNDIITIDKLKHLPEQHKELFDIVVDLSEIREDYNCALNRYDMTEKEDYELNNKQIFDNIICSYFRV